LFNVLGVPTYRVFPIERVSKFCPEEDFATSAGILEPSPDRFYSQQTSRASQTLIVTVSVHISSVPERDSTISCVREKLLILIVAIPWAVCPRPTLDQRGGREVGYVRGVQRRSYQADVLGTMNEALIWEQR
jgi:hypothetical protein